MKYQSFCMRVLCLLLILAAVIGYNSMQKKDTQEQETQAITQLQKRVDTLEEQQKEMLAALEEAAKNQETAKAQAETDTKDDAVKEEAADREDAESTDDSENFYKDGTYTAVQLLNAIFPILPAALLTVSPSKFTDAKFTLLYT